jgi:hypothetical protein
MRRRALLSLFGAGAAGLAGCTDRLPAVGSGAPEESPDGSGGDPTDSPTDGPDVRRVEMGESAIVDKQMLRVANPRVRATVMQDASAWQSLAVPDGQFVVVDVTARGPVPEHRRDLTFGGTVDGEPTGDDPVLVAVDGAGGPFRPPDWEARRVAIPFPAASHERASVYWQVDDTTVRWPLDEATRQTLAAAPSFRVEELSARRVDGDVELTLAVANHGDRDARFQARVSFEAIHDASSAIAFDVPAGETASYEGVPRILEYHDIRTVTVQHPADGEAQRTELSVPAPERTATATPVSGEPTATGE